jgi:ubiquinone/menaquinone biosynthesis C-methylase UbiE
MSIKKNIGKVIRKLNIAGIADRFRFYSQYMVNYFSNKKFLSRNPSINFPPPYFLYETYELNYNSYYNDGLQTASETVSILRPFVNFDQPGKALLDWGCGPGRIVRHLPALLKGQHAIYGSDYNASYVDWCSKNLLNITFVKNELKPPIQFANNSFDAVYGLSIITHLSAPNHFAWIAELWRILKPGGILLLTSQGNQFKEKLLNEELEVFNKAELVIRGPKQEGQRIFAAFQPETFMRDLLKDFKLIRFIEGGTTESIHGKQDTWLVQK